MATVDAMQEQDPAPGPEPGKGRAVLADEPEDLLWSILAGLHGQRTTVLLRAQDGSLHGTSLVLRVDSRQHLFLLDARSGEAVPALKPDEKLWLESRVEGRRLELSCRIRERTELPDGPAWIVDCPELLVNEQRRGLHRLKIGGAAALKADLVHDDAPRPVPAQVLDISRRGIAAQLPQVAAVGSGQRISCRLVMADFRLDVNAVVRYRRIEADGTRLGLEFDELSVTQEAALSKAVFALERQILRARRREKNKG